MFNGREGISGFDNFVSVSFVMEPLIASSANCEIRSVIRLHAEGNSAAEIHRRLCHVYGDGVMSDLSVREWCRKLKNGRSEVHDEDERGRVSQVTDELVEEVDKAVRTRRRSNREILLVEFLPAGTTINSDVYCDTIKKLRRSIQNKRRGRLTKGIVLLHDNARPHTAARTSTLLSEIGWEVFDHPPYSSDLAPNDFHLFAKMKN